MFQHSGFKIRFADVQDKSLSFINTDLFEKSESFLFPKLFLNIYFKQSLSIAQ